MAESDTRQASFSICGYSFEGPYTRTDSLLDRAGIYVICDKRLDEKWYILDVGESGNVKTRVENHERQACWERNREGMLGVAVLYTPGWTPEQRRALESTIRAKYAPPCGKE